MERTELAHDAIDQIRDAVAVVSENTEISFDGNDRDRGQRSDVIAAKDRLAADDEDVDLAGGRAGRSQEMGEMLAIHGRVVDVGVSANARRTAWRSDSLNTPANGVFWRRSTASVDVEVSISRTASEPASRSRCHART